MRKPNIEKKKNKNPGKVEKVDYWMLLIMYRGIWTQYFLALTPKFLDFQSSLHSALLKYTTLNTNEPSSKLPKHYNFPSIISNSPTTLALLGITQSTLKNWKKELHNSLTIL
jgi:hypothetical protein